MGNNIEIRREIARNFLRHWQVAAQIGVHESVLCRMLRTELAPAEKGLILDAIEKLSGNGEEQRG